MTFGGRMEGSKKWCKQQVWVSFASNFGFFCCLSTTSSYEWRPWRLVVWFGTFCFKRWMVMGASLINIRSKTVSLSESILQGIQWTLIAIVPNFSPVFDIVWRQSISAERLSVSDGLLQPNLVIKVWLPHLPFRERPTSLGEEIARATCQLTDS